MRNSKKLLCMLLSLIMVFSVFTVASVPAGAYNSEGDFSETSSDDGVIYFDAASAGWSGASWISFYIYEIGGDNVTEWGAKNKKYTSHEGDIWAFNAEEAGVLLGHEYGIIFYNLDTSAQTADLLFNYSCFGDTAYVPDPDDMIENPVDSNKKSMKAAWKNSSLGTIKYITSIGNVVGESIPNTTSVYQMMVNFLASKGPQSLMNALNLNGKDAQTTIDDTAKALGLDKDDVEQAIKEAKDTGANDGSGDRTDWSNNWSESRSTLPGGSDSSGGHDPSDIPTGKSKMLNFYVPTSEWHDFEKIGFYIYEIGGEEFIPWGSKRMFNSEETSPGVWSFDLGNAGIVLEDSKAYSIIFVNKETMAQTAPLLLDSSCMGDTAYCDGTRQENEVDSNKTSLVARWKNSSLGPVKCITSIGNVVGETIPANTTAYNMFVDFLKYTLSNARMYSGKTDQSIIDDVAGAFYLTKDDASKAIAESGVYGIDWRADKSTLSDKAKDGVKVSGKIRSYLSDTDPISVLLMQDGKVKKNVNVKGNSAEYSFDDVKAGNYTMLVTKKNHVNREYTMTVAGADVTKDVKLCPKGDVNGDGETDIMDCSVAQRYIRELTTLDAYQIACGDVSGTGDGELDIQDVSRILRHIRELAMLY